MFQSTSFSINDTLETSQNLKYSVTSQGPMAFIAHTMTRMRPGAGWEVKVKLWICIQLLSSLRSCQALQPLSLPWKAWQHEFPQQWESPRSPAEWQELKGCRRMERAVLYKPTVTPVCSFGTAKPLQNRGQLLTEAKPTSSFAGWQMVM